MNNPKALGKQVNILKQGATEEKGETAQITNFIGALAICDLVKTTLGPKGMDKILISTGEHSRGEIQVTNDGATILKSIQVDNPAAKVLVDISKTQDEEVGDGTTSVCVLAGELLREAEKLIEKKIHPQTIIAGWRKALAVAYKTLENSAIDNSQNPEKFKEGVDETIQFQLGFPSGAVASCLSTYSMNNLDRFFLNGEKGFAEMQPSTGYGPIEGRTNKGELNFPHVTHQTVQMDEMSDIILKGKKPSVPVDGTEGVKDMKIIDAIFLAVKTGKKVDLKL